MPIVGLVMAPSGLVMMAMAPISARILKTKGPKVTLMLGAVVVAAGYGLGIVMMSEIWQLVAISSIIGLSYGAMPALVMSAVPNSDTVAANSLNTLTRSIGTSVSSAVAGVILAQLTISLGPHRFRGKAGSS